MRNQIIPSINCSDFECIKNRIGLASTFLNAESENWVHIDVSDGKFTPHISWNNPEELGEFRIQNSELKINTEVHLMIENPEAYIDAWLKTGVKRIIVHLEVMQDSVLILEKCKKYGAECFLAIKPETEVDRLFAYSAFNGFLILGVSPGPSGQKMDQKIFEKIKKLRNRFQNSIIEVDGGINLETAKLASQAGATYFVSGAYIFDSSDPAVAYRKLQDAV